MDAKKIATKIVKAIKDEIKKNKETQNGRNYYVQQSVYVDTDSTYDAKKKAYTYYIRVGKTYFKDLGLLSDAAQVNREVMQQLNELKSKSRTYKNLQFRTNKITDGCGWNSRSYTLLESVLLPDNPCKEFKSFQNYMKKYGNVAIPDFTLYSCYGGGKRGYLYGEEGDRSFLDNKPNKCARVLAEIRKARGSKDSITCHFGKEEYIDPIDKQYSQYHEVECDGEYRNYVQVIVKSPTGKVKYDQKIY